MAIRDNMTKLLYDSYEDVYYLDKGLFRIEYPFDGEEGYYYEIFFDGERVRTCYPMEDVWTLSDAVDASLNDVEEIISDITEMQHTINNLDKDWVDNHSEITKDFDYE